MTRMLINDGHAVHALARTPQSLRTLSAGLEPDQTSRLHATPVDYQDQDRFAQTLAQLPDSITHAICWVHSPAQEPMAQVRERYPHADLLHVLGSRSASVLISPPCRTVRLGAIVEQTSARWLTHDEISRGVYAAFRSGRIKSTVGSIDRLP